MLLDCGVVCTYECSNVLYKLYVSSVYSCHTAVVPVAPVSVTVDTSTVTPESAVVTWSPLAGAYTGGYDIVRYIVSYKREDEEWSMAKTLDAKPDAWQATLVELEPNSTYSASVKGENALGEGFPAESQMFTTPELCELQLHMSLLAQVHHTSYLHSSSGTQSAQPCGSNARPPYSLYNSGSNLAV